jgi:hypothetical protein
LLIGKTEPTRQVYLSRYMATSDRLAWRVERALARVIGSPTDLELAENGDAALPLVRGFLPQAATRPITLTVKILSNAGIPLARAAVRLEAGDRAFETPVTLLSMEGYAHLSDRARKDVERRVWSRRAYATGSVA